MIVRQAIASCDGCKSLQPAGPREQHPAWWVSYTDPAHGPRWYCSQACCMEYATGGTMPTNLPLRFGLVPQDMAVLTLLGEGLTDKEIATRMGQAQSTIKNRADDIRRKLGTHDRIATVLVAHSHGLLNLHVLSMRCAERLAKEAALSDAGG